MAEEEDRVDERTERLDRTEWHDDCGEWPTERTEVAYEEARTVLTTQREDLSEIDEKSLRTVRTTVVLLGVTATAVRAVGAEPFDLASTVLGVGLLVVSLISGVVSYSQSNEVIGPTGPYLERLARDAFERAWHEELVHQFTAYIEQNRRTLEVNGWLLLVSQSSLVGGITAISLSVFPLVASLRVAVTVSVMVTVALFVIR
jgi:hypothetical protein